MNSTAFGKDDLYVSTAGREHWSGRLAEPNADGTDGPLATVQQARDLLRVARERALVTGPVTVWIRGGVYRLEKPLRFEPQDGGPITYAAYPGEEPVFDGGIEITGWEETVVHDRRAWVADVSEQMQEKYRFQSLFVNGERRPRVRLPKTGFYWMEEAPHAGTVEEPGSGGLIDGTDRFRVKPGDIQEWRNLQCVEVVATHFWVEERMPLASYDPETGWCESWCRSIFVLKDDFQPRPAKYHVENVFEGLTEPGEWYHDRKEGRLYYLPREGETLENTAAAVGGALQLLRLHGDPERARPVTGLKFRGLAFEHTDWDASVSYGKWHDPEVEFGNRKTRDAYRHFTLNDGMDPDALYAAMPQAAFHVPGVIGLWGAENCTIENCRVAHVGWYGIELGEGCFGNRIVGNTITDLGAGGIKLDGADELSPHCRQNGRNRITDNHVSDGGHVFFSACGMALIHSYGNEVSHNHIHDFYYTGISCGWVWGFAENVSRENRIEKNHIHHLGKGVLSDMGGIYILGVQPGTMLRGNLIHDVEKANYGGWAIYPDEGSSHLVIENNVCYNTSSQPYHLHYGREITVRNNIWAFGREGQIAVSRGPGSKTVFPFCGVNNRCAMTFERNIVITDGQPIFVPSAPDSYPEHKPFISDLNVFWDVSGAPIVSGPYSPPDAPNPPKRYEWETWQALGCDRHSVVADPKCVDPRGGDFTLAEDSPALELGFQPIDMSDVGPREEGERVWE